MADNAVPTLGGFNSQLQALGSHLQALVNHRLAVSRIEPHPPVVPSNSVLQSLAAVKALASPSKQPTVPPLQCSICPAQFSGSYAKYNLKKHVQAKHENRPPLTCPACSYSTTTKAYLKNHMLAVHSIYLDDIMSTGGN